MALQVEDVDYAFPNRLPVERLFDGLSRNQRGLSAVLALDSLF